MGREKAAPITTAIPVDPPTRVHGKYDWSAIARTLRAQPMQWHLVFEDDKHSRAVSVKQGNVKVVHPDAGFEYQTTNTHYPPPDLKRWCSLYMRYNPEKDRSND